jgi:hypothetical protein
MNGIAMQIEDSYQPKVHVGDRMRFTTVLLRAIHEMPNHTSEIVVVREIHIEADGTRTLYVSRLEDVEAK